MRMFMTAKNEKHTISFFRPFLLLQLILMIPFVAALFFRAIFPSISDAAFIRFFLNHKKYYLLALFLFSLSDVLHIKRGWLSAHKTEVGALLGITVLSTLLLFMPGVSKGHDLPFHLTRIEGITDAIKHYQFPVRIQPLWFDGYGYPVSIYYGDLFLSIPVALRLFNVPLGLSYELYIFFITFATALTSHICVKRMFKNTAAGLVASLAYTTANYRLVDVFTRSAVGEYTAFIAFPVVALAIFNIYTNNDLSRRTIFKNALLLALGLSALILTHILSSELTVFILLILCAVLWKKTCTKIVLAPILLAAALTLLFTAWFTVPFLDYFKNVSVVVQNLGVRHIQYAGVYIVQLFSFFQTPQGLQTPPINSRMPLTPGFLLMGGGILSIIFLVYKKKDRLLILFVSFALLTMLFATNLFPYDAMATSAFGNLLAQIQFPYRWLSLSIVFLTLALARLFVLETGKNQTLKCAAISAIVFVAIFQTSYFTSSFFKLSENHFIADYKEFGTIPSHGNEYIIFGTDVGKRDGLVHESGVSILGQERDANSFLLAVESNGGGYIDLPLFNYKGYRAALEDGTLLTVQNGDNNVVRVIVPAGTKGKIHASFKPPVFWRIAELVSLLSLIATFAVLFCYNTRFHSFFSKD